MSLYENNLKAFAQHYPLTAAKLLQISENNRFEVFQDPNDPLNVNIYDHEKEAIFYQGIPQQTILNQIDLYEAEYSRYPVLFIYGIANGLFIKLLLQNKNHQFVIVIEPELELLYIAFNLIDFTKEITEKRVHFFLDEQMDFVRASGIFSDSQIKVFSKTYQLEPNSEYYENHYSSSLLHINSIMTRAIEHVITGLGNDSVDALTGLEWHLANVSKMVETPTLVELITKMKTTQTAVIVSTGPSLAKQIPLLSKIKEHVTILSVDASLPILEQNGIKPDLVYSIERVPITAHFYKQTSQEFLNGIISVVSSISHPVLVDSLGETTMQMNMRPFGYTRYFNMSDYGYVGIGMSAANLAYETAFHARFKTIILIGQDLAFGEDGQSHSDGHVLHTIKHKESDSYITAYGGNGVVRTSMLWNMFRNFYETDIQSANEIGLLTINATEGGARIHGALELPFQDAIKHYVDTSVRKIQIKLEQPSSDAIQDKQQNVEEKITQMQEYVTSMQEKVSGLFEKVAGCVEHLDKIKAKKNLQKVNYDELAQLMGEIDEIKSKFDEPMFADIFIDATQALIVHQELELARIQVRPIATDDDRRVKMIDWIYAHKAWLFSLAGIMDAEKTVIERRGADAYILRDAEIVANRVVGYIVDLKDLSKTFDVELVIDGEVVEYKSANQLLRHHLLDQPSHSRFNFEIPERFFDNHIHTIIVKDRKSGMYLSSDLTPVILLESAKINGSVRQKTPFIYNGWCKKAGSDESQTVDVYIDEQYIETIETGKHFTTFEYIIGESSVCFEYIVPENLFDGKEHNIKFDSSSGFALSDEKMLFKCDNEALDKRNQELFVRSFEISPIGRNVSQANSLGFLAVEENISQDYWIDYLKKLLDRFEFIRLKVFYFNDTIKETAKKLLNDHKQIDYIPLHNIHDIAKNVQLYVWDTKNKLDLQIAQFLLMKYDEVAIVHNFYSNSFITLDNYSLIEFDNFFTEKKEPIISDPFRYGFKQNEIDKYGFSYHKLMYEALLGRFSPNYTIDLNQSALEFHLYDQIEIMLKNSEFKKAFIKVYQLRNSLLKAS